MGVFLKTTDIKHNPSVSKSILPFYGYETDGSPLEISHEAVQEQSMVELWNRLHKDRPIGGVSGNVYPN